jgi:hypothetical protein
MRDVKKVKDVSTSSHPSENELTVTMMFEDGTYEWVLFSQRVCQQLEDSLRRSREGYLPWIKEEFEFVGGDATWKCRTCKEIIEGNASKGGLLLQFTRHLVEKHFKESGETLST